MLVEGWLGPGGCSGGRRKGQGVNTCAQVKGFGSRVGGRPLGHLQGDASRQLITRVCSFFPTEICTFTPSVWTVSPDSRYGDPPYLTLFLPMLYHHTPFISFPTLLKHPWPILISKVLTKSSLSAFLLSPHFQQASLKEPPVNAILQGIKPHCRHNPVSIHFTLEALLSFLF